MEEKANVKFVGMRRIRNEREMRAEDLAKLVGCSTRMIYIMERGEVNPSFKMVHHISEVLNVRIDDLVN